VLGNFPCLRLLRKVILSDLLSFYCFEICDVESFRFDTAKTVTTPSAGAAMDLGGKDVCTTESLSSRESPIKAEAAFTRKAGMLDITLALGCGGTVNRDAIYGLLIECLRDVSFAIPAVSYLFVRYWVFNFSRFSI
jgi:hypothetical protein